MVRTEVWNIYFNNKILEVMLYVTYPGKEVTASTKASDRTEFEILTVTDMQSNFVYDSFDEPYKPVPDNLLNAIINDNFLNPPQTVQVMESYPDDTGIDSPHEIIVKKPLLDDDDTDSDEEDEEDLTDEEDDDYLTDDDEDDDENDTPNRFN